MLNSHATPDPASRVSNKPPGHHGRFQWLRRLSQTRWFVLFGIGILVIILEVRNHTSMWHQHQSGQTIWTDQELIWEIFVYGLIIPILTGIILGYTERAATERNRIARELELRQALVSQMREAQSWRDLVNLIVTAPGHIVTAERAWLLSQRSDEETFDQIASWEHLASNRSQPVLPVSPDTCARCKSNSAPNKNGLLTFQCPNAPSDTQHAVRYCLWLSSKGMGRTALLFDVPTERPLDPSQLKTLDDLGNEMSLVIDNHNLQLQDQRRADVVKSEQQRIARDLHDTLGQNVSYLRLKLDQLSNSKLTSGQAELQDELSRLLAVADVAYEQVRDTLDALRKKEHRDLEEIIRLHASQAADRAGFSATVHSSGHARQLAPRQTRQIIFIAREALNNIEKHANARKIDIFIHWQGSEFRLIVCDDGTGFNPATVNKTDRYGMTIMHERAQAINANLAIESAPGQGTELTLTLPLGNRATAVSDVS